MWRPDGRARDAGRFGRRGETGGGGGAADASDASDASDDDEVITDYYVVLGLRDAATPAEIKKAYRKLARQYHPDKNLRNAAQSKRIFQHITEAHDVLSDPDRRRAYDQEWGPDVAWCSGGYARQRQHSGGGGSDSYQQRPTRAATAENRRSTMASAFTNAFSSQGGGSDFESAVNAWDSMMDQLLQPIKKRGAIRFQKLFRGYLVRKGLGPKFRAFLRRSRKEDDEDNGRPIADGASIRVGPVPGASTKGKYRPRPGPRPPPMSSTAAAPAGATRPQIRLRAKTAPAFQKKNKKTRSPPKTKLTQPPPVPQRNSSRLPSTRTRTNFNNNRIKTTPPPSPPRRNKKIVRAVEQDTGKRMHIAIQRASHATVIERAFKAHLAHKKDVAAVRIQALARGANIRSGLARAYLRAAAAARKKFLQTLHHRVTLLQSRVRGHLARDSARTRQRAASRLMRWAKYRMLQSTAMKEAKLARVVARARAALQIQRAARGRLGRRVALTKKRVLRITRELAKRQRRRKSARTLQAFVRLWMPRYKIKQRKTQENRSAAILQHNMRGWIFCRHAARLKAVRRAKADVAFVVSVVGLVLECSEKWRRKTHNRRSDAAAHLQRLWRGHAGRIAVAQLSQTRTSLRRQSAAIQLQSAFRAFTFRTLCHQREEAARRSNHATRVQALVRGVSTRTALALKERVVLMLQCRVRSRLARIRANTVRTLRWFNRRNTATFIIQRFMRAWLARVASEKERVRILEGKARDESQAACRIQAWTRAGAARRQLATRRGEEQGNRWRAAIVALRMARQMQSVIKDGRASRWQALHGTVKLSHGVLKLRRAVLAGGVGGEKIGFQTRRDFAGPGKVGNQKHMMKSPNRARRVLRSSNPARSRSARSGLNQDLCKALSVVCSSSHGSGGGGGGGGGGSGSGIGGGGVRRNEKGKERLPSLDFNINGGRKRVIRSAK